MRKTRIALILGLLIFGIIGVAYFAGNYGYDKGYNAGEEDGWNDGFYIGKDAGWEAGLDEGKLRGYAEGLVDGKESGYGLGYAEGYEVGLAEANDIPISGQGYLVNRDSVQFMMRTMLLYPNTLPIRGSEEHPAFLWMRFVVNTGNHGEYLTFQFVLIDTAIEDVEGQTVIESLLEPDENGKFESSFYYETPYDTELIFGFSLYDVRSEQGTGYYSQYVANWEWMFGEWNYVYEDVEVPEAEVVVI